MASYRRAVWRDMAALTCLRADPSRFFAASASPGSSDARAAGRDLRGLPSASVRTTPPSGVGRAMTVRSP